MQRFVLSLLALAATATHATEPARPPASAPVSAPPASAPAEPAGPRVTGLFRIVRPDGATVIAQAAIATTASGALPVLNVADKDAFATSNGRCAFNVKYDERSSRAVSGTANRLYDNDVLVARNTSIDVAAGAVKTVWTQLWLAPGANNLRVVVNADSAAVSLGWVRVNVAGHCGAAASAPPPASAPAAQPATIQPGSGDWNSLRNAWGYSNYAVTQLKDHGYARYADLVRANQALTQAINAQAVSSAQYAQLMATWNGFLTDPAFKAAMATIQPPTPGVK